MADARSGARSVPKEPGAHQKAGELLRTIRVTLLGLSSQYESLPLAKMNISENNDELKYSTYVYVHEFMIIFFFFFLRKITHCSLLEDAWEPIHYSGRQ